MPNDKNQLISIYNNIHSIDYRIDDRQNNLSSSSIQTTLNAWTKGSFVDGIGQVWISEDSLFLIWRTDKATANFFIDSISSKDKSDFGRGLCIKYAAVIYRLNNIIEAPIKDKRREYLKISDDIGRAVRDATPVEVIRLKYKEFIDETKKKLKSQRIKKYGISRDELTGKSLNIQFSEFHHIRRQSIFPDMISLIWNGLIVDRETHAILTQYNISDEYDLQTICIDRNWSLDWVERYQESLKLLN